MAIVLNLGCGSRASPRPGVVNIDWSVMLRFRRNPILRALAPIAMQGERLKRFRALPKNILVHNLARGIPFDADSVDVVYHSHALEHMDRDVAGVFVREAHRVLKPGGIHRVVVPDFEQLCKNYVAHAGACERDARQLASHDDYVAAILEQSVRKEAWGTSQQGRVRRVLENVVLGDARRRGETHQWMYDRFNLSHLLDSAGFESITLRSHNTSDIPDWQAYGLDQGSDGHEYKPGSLYIEARK